MYNYSHKMNRNKFNELETIRKYYYEINKNFDIIKESESVKVNINMLKSKILKANNGILEPETIRKEPLGYGYNKTAIPYLLIECYKKERDNIRKEHFFDDNYKELQKELFNKLSKTDETANNSFFDRIKKFFKN